MRWSFDNSDDDGSGRDSSFEQMDEQFDQKYTHTYKNSQFHRSSVSPTKVFNSKSLPKSLATNFDGRWSLSTRRSYDESENWIKQGISQIHETNGQPLSLMICDDDNNEGGDSSDATYVDAEDLYPLSPKQTDSDEDSHLSPLNMPLFPRGTAAHLRRGWSEYDDDEDDSDREEYSNFSHKYRKQESYGDRRKLGLGALLTHRSTKTNSSSQPGAQVNNFEKSKSVSPKGPKPPIKPRKKLPKSQSAVTSPPEQVVMTTSSSEPVLHTPKAAPRKPFVRAVSVRRYDQISGYESIRDIDQGHLEKIVWAAQNDGLVSEHNYYNLSSPLTHSDQVERSRNPYDKIQGYEKIQTYETIPYHLELDHIGVSNL